MAISGFWDGINTFLSGKETQKHCPKAFASVWHSREGIRVDVLEKLRNAVDDEIITSPTTEVSLEAMTLLCKCSSLNHVSSDLGGEDYRLPPATGFQYSI